VDSLVDTSVSEEHIASIFRSKDGRIPTLMTNISIFIAAGTSDILLTGLFTTEGKMFCKY
jgi:hypothetical protein